MRVVIKKVGKLGEIKDIKGTLEEFQEIVGGHIEQFPINDNLYILLNEEGKINSLEPNIGVPCANNQVEVIVGNIVFVSLDGEDFGGLEDEQIQLLKTIGILPKDDSQMGFYPIARHLKDKTKVIVDTGRSL